MFAGVYTVQGAEIIGGMTFQTSRCRLLQRMLQAAAAAAAAVMVGRAVMVLIGRAGVRGAGRREGEPQHPNAQGHID